MLVSIEKIQTEVARKAMTTGEFLRAAEVPKGTWYSIKRSKRANTSTIGKIANALKVDVLDIIIHEEV